MKRLTLLALLVMAPLGIAQDTTNPAATPTSKEDLPYQDDLDENGFWQGALPGGSYLVALNKITSISKHEYLLDGNLIITEVTIDTLGDTTLRVYQITPAAQQGSLATPSKVVERGRDLLDRVGQRTGADLESMVHKQYPTTTHSKTIEFRVKDLGTLSALHGSATKAWTTGKGRKFSVK